MTPGALVRFGGFEASAAFAILQRLFGAVQQGHALLLGPLWPAYAEAATRGDAAWLRRSFRISITLTLGAAAAVAGIAALVPWILPRWLGAEAPALTAGFVWLTAGGIALAMVAQAFAWFLLGLGRLQPIAMRIAVGHALTIAGMVGLGAAFGGTGVVAALAAGTALALLPLLAIAAWRAARNLSTRPAADAKR
ncbi:MAG: hypothetical protein RLZZ15_2956 [Verrucomicrobiota bacterium]